MRPWLVLLAVLAAAVVFRLPPLLNAGAINSDAAVVGLQARHLLSGEWSWHLWGAPYQGSLDVVLAALALKVLPVAPALAVIAVPFVGLLLMVALTWDLLRRHLGDVGAALAVVPQVFASMPANLPMFFVMRQTMASLVVLAVWLCEVRPSKTRLFLTAVAMGFAAWTDTFAVVMLAPLGLLVVVQLVAAPRAERVGRLLAVSCGAALVAPLASMGLRGSQGFTTFSRLGFNADLLWRECLPFVAGAKVFISHSEAPTSQWLAPAGVQVLLWLTAASWVAGFVFAVVSLLFHVEAPVRRLGLLGVGTAGAALAAFLLSARPEDVWAARYLAPITWMAPFALAPAVAALRARRALWALTPLVLGALVSGWAAYGELVDGARVVTHPRAAQKEERELKAFLDTAGVRVASGNYWLAYRLTFLFDEAPIVVPFEGDDERYAPWQAQFEADGKRAYLFHPSALRNTPDAELARLGERYQRHEVAGFTVLLAPP